ncbi:MAG: D-ribose pyranase [Dictyoglomus sp. NZ13-RE01]|nr:MAG: D-ribose pyranase [Dictyoglomus sp. NZ13-RE01]
MKKGGILNPELIAVLSSLGHTDLLVICDAGFPIPKDVKRIDLTLVKNIPRFLDILKAIYEEIVIEKVILAEEIEKTSPELLEKIKEIIGNTPIEFVSHTKFKEISKNAKGIVRSAEFTPYANIILVCGVAF